MRVLFFISRNVRPVFASFNTHAIFVGYVEFHIADKVSDKESDRRTAKREI